MKWLSPLLAVIAIDLWARRQFSAPPIVASALIVVAFFKVRLFSASIWLDIGSALLRPFV